jgi:hypothetical protein
MMDDKIQIVERKKGFVGGCSDGSRDYRRAEDAA